MPHSNADMHNGLASYLVGSYKSSAPDIKVVAYGAWPLVA